MPIHQDIRYGSARFAEKGEIKRAGLYQDTGAYLGVCPYTNKPLLLDSDPAITTIAGAGSGKGRDILLHQAISYPGSMLINDPKGELAAVSVFNQHKLNKKAYCINPCGLHTAEPWLLPMHSVNPLDILQKNSSSLISDIKLIMEMLIISSGDSHSEFFEQRARDWCGSVLLWLIMSDKKISLPLLYNTINLIESHPSTWEQQCESKMLQAPYTSIKRTAAEIRFKRNNASGEYSGVMATIFKNLDFLDDPLMTQCLGHSDFSLEVLTKEKVNIYLMVRAENLDIWKSFMRIIVGVAMLYKLRAPSADRVVFLIDEAGQLGHFEMLEKAYTFGQGMGIRAWAVFQDIGQIQRNYTEYGVNTFLGSSQVRQFFGVRNYETALLVSNMLGKTTFFYDDLHKQAEIENEKKMIAEQYSNSDHALSQYKFYHRLSDIKDAMERSLMTPDEIMRMSEKEQLIFSSGLDLPPLRANKVPYYEQQDLFGKFLPNPYYPPFDNIPIIKLGFKKDHKLKTEQVSDEFKEKWPQYQQGKRSVI